jgi:hypothetical protein
MEANLEAKGLGRESWLEFGTLHVHGYESAESRIIIPSLSDLRWGLTEREKNQAACELDIPTINMIANWVANKEVEALVYREPLEYSPLTKPAIAEEIEATLDELSIANATQEEVLEAFRHYQYQAAMVRFLNGELRKEDREFIQSLGMTTRRGG